MSTKKNGMPPEGACRSGLIRPYGRRTKAERQMRLFDHREAGAKESGCPAKNKQTNRKPAEPSECDLTMVLKVLSARGPRKRLGMGRIDNRPVR
jgi:hypothetical protein